MYCNSGGQAGGQPVQLTGVRMLNNSAALGGAIFSYTHCRRVGPRGACGPVCCCCGRRAAPLCMAQACGGRSRADTSAQQPPMSWHTLPSLPPLPLQHEPDQLYAAAQQRVTAWRRAGRGRGRSSEPHWLRLGWQRGAKLLGNRLPTGAAAPQRCSLCPAWMSEASVALAAQHCSPCREGGTGSIAGSIAAAVRAAESPAMPALHAVCVVLQSHLQALTARRVHAVQAGGAIYVGLPAFNPNPSCDEASAVAGAAVVRLKGGALRGNLAAGSGGGAHLAAGHLEMQARLAGTGRGRWPGPRDTPPNRTDSHTLCAPVRLLQCCSQRPSPRLFRACLYFFAGSGAGRQPGRNGRRRRRRGRRHLRL